MKSEPSSTLYVAIISNVLPVTRLVSLINPKEFEIMSIVTNIKTALPLPHSSWNLQDHRQVQRTAMMQTINERGAYYDERCWLVN